MMKMNLKNKSFKKLKLNKIKLTSKNLFLFILSFSIITLIIGIIFYYLMSSADKETVNSSINNYFTIKTNINYLNEIKKNILSNTYNIFLIWILGISVIGVLACIFIYFCEIFSIGVALASIFNIYSIKGIIASICYLFLSKACYLVMLFIITFLAIKISYKIILVCFSKQEINIKKEIEKYIKILIIAFIFVIVISLAKVFIDPMLIKLFTRC